MSFFNRLTQLLGLKSSEARAAIAMQRLGEPVRTTSNYLGFSKEGYQKNVVVFRCIRLIATACSGIKWELYVNGREVETHPILDLIQKPNPMQGWSSFFESVIAYYQIAGNTYIEGVGPNPNSPPTELYSLRPDLMRIIPNAFGNVSAYEFKTANQTRTWPADPITGKSKILHVKTFHPTDIWYGLSPIEAVILNVDQSNAANKWNLALLQNMASPSGILKIDPTDANPTGSLTPQQRADLQSALEGRFSGASNAARPMVLEGGMSWQTISLSPREMEWLESKKITSNDICNAFGVPAQLLGFGQTTYSNYKEAREAFYTETILPIMDLFEFELTNYFRWWFGDQIDFKYDRDDIEALTKKREAKYQIINSLNFITQNEKRALAGYEPIENWDVFLIGNRAVNDPEVLNELSTYRSRIQDLRLTQSPGSEDPSDSRDSQEDDKSAINQTLEWKTFNLLTQREKTQTLRRINRYREAIELGFAKALEQDFNDAALKIAKAYDSTSDQRLREFAIERAIDESMAEMSNTLRKFIQATVFDFGRRVFQDAKHQNLMMETKQNEKTWEQWAQRFINTRTANAITHIRGTTKKIVREKVRELTARAIEGEELDFAGELQSEFKNLSESRAILIARTEVTMASNSATHESVKALEIPNLKKEWVSADDERVRDGGKDGTGPNHMNMNGIKIPMDEPFSVPPDDTMDYPGDPNGSAGNVINCRCVLTYGL